MATHFNSAGVKVKYCVESTAGSRPSTGYTALAGAKSIPSFNSEPPLLQSTTLDALTYHTYVTGLRDLGSAFAISFNDSEELRAAWASCVAAYATAEASNKAMWFEYYLPNFSSSFFFKGEPLPMGFGGAEVDSVLEVDCYIVPKSEPAWYASV